MSQHEVTKKRYISCGARIRNYTKKQVLDPRDDCCLSVTHDNHTLVVSQKKSESEFGGAKENKSATVAEKHKFPLQFCLQSFSPDENDYDRLGPYVDQIDLYDQFGDAAVQHVEDGDDVMICTFGAHESGKLYTLLGKDWRDPEDAGLLPQIARRILYNIDEANEDDDDEEEAAASSTAVTCYKYKLLVRAFEVHGDTLQDLLTPRDWWKPEGHSLKELPDKSGYFCTDLMFHQVENIDALHQIIDKAQKNATQRSSQEKNKRKKQNSTTSASSSSGVPEEEVPRSHVFFQLMYQKIYVGTKKGDEEKVLREASITFAVLAGFDERLNDSASGVFTNSKIHQNLDVFQDCLHRAADGKLTKDIPYDSSLLTKVLKHSIEKAFVTVVGCVSPAESEATNTIKTLQFCSKLLSTEDAKKWAPPPPSSPVASRSGQLSASPLMSQSSFLTPSGARNAASSRTVQQLLGRVGELESLVKQLALRVEQLESGKK